MKFKKPIAKYKHFIKKYGYKRGKVSLLWFFNQNYKATKEDEKYFIVYKNKYYDVDEVLDLFIGGEK